MPNPLDELLSYALRVVGLDDEWKQHGACRDIDGDKRRWFTCGEKDEVKIAGATVNGYEAHRHALQICFNCPVQWECARWAIEADERSCIWSLSPRDMKWLRNQQNPLGIIDAARVEGVAMQTAVSIVRRQAV